MPSHAFVDESKRKGFSLIRCDVPLTDVDAIRSDLRALLRPGQRRIHFYKESPTTRSAVFRVIARYDVRTTVFTSRQHESLARPTCLVSMGADAASSRVSHLTIEADETQRERDRQALHPLLAPLSHSIIWRHLRAFEEPGLWIPDAIGWCLDHPDRKWRDAITPFLIERVWL